MFERSSYVNEFVSIGSYLEVLIFFFGDQKLEQVNFLINMDEVIDILIGMCGKLWGLMSIQ